MKTRPPEPQSPQSRGNPNASVGRTSDGALRPVSQVVPDWSEPVRSWSARSSVGMRSMRDNVSTVAEVDDQTCTNLLLLN